MNIRFFWRYIFHPDLPGGMILICLFLFISAVGNVFKLYDTATTHNYAEMPLNIAATLFYAVPAFGLARLKKWARLFEIIYSLLMVLLGLIVLVTSTPAEGAFIIITHGLIVFYLLSAKCRQLFNGQ